MTSMTGFGRSQRRHRLGTVTAEVRSVNHRYLETSCRLPDGCAGLEDPVRALVQSVVRRGKVTVTVTVTSSPTVAATVNPAVARRYLDGLRGLQRRLKVPGAITMEALLALPGVVGSAGGASGPSRTLILQAVRAALRPFAAVRRREGQALARMLKRLTTQLERATAALAARAPQVIVEYRARLAERLQVLTTQPLDPGRLEQEVAFFAKECDIAEEVARIQAHVAHLKRLLAATAAVGRTLDFVAQELHREVNTIGSKANDVEIAHLAIQMKGWVEQLREQAQNLE